MSSPSPSSSSTNPYVVPRNHRLHPGYSHPVLHQWQQPEHGVAAHDLVYPIFVVEDDAAKVAIGAMPGQYRWGVSRLDELIAPLVRLGLRSVLLFGVLSNDAHKDEIGSYSAHVASPVARAVRHLRATYPSLYIMCDICLCAYTTHGHCGVCHADGTIDNARSIERIAAMATFLAQQGAHCVAPSDMMDGRIGAIKHSLAQHGLDGRVAVCSYAAKFASCFYGPFREAASSGAKFGDRSLYQLPPGARGLAVRAVDRDVAEGADMVMVKPAGPYLDIVREVRDRVEMPVAVYHVSGEFAMLYHAAQHGAFDLQQAVFETLNGFRRAGATILITYFTPDVLQWLYERKVKEVDAVTSKQ